MSGAAFEELYQREPDPFSVGTSWYERRKLSLALAGLTQPTYRLAWDAACGTGHLARSLAARAEKVLATDASATAVGLTRGLTDGLNGVCAEVSALPTIPLRARQADLVVLSEVMYYLSQGQRHDTYAGVCELVAEEVLMVSWLHDPHDAQIAGGESVEEAVGLLSPAYRPRFIHREDDFVIATLTRRAP